MIIRIPEQEDIPQMKKLWQKAFGDPDECIDAFFDIGYRQERSRILWENEVLGAVYWFDFLWQGSRYGFLYALAVKESRRGKGLGNDLMEQVCKELQSCGYAGALLVPAGPHLHGFYNRLGFTHFGSADALMVKAAGEAVYMAETDIQGYLKDHPGFSWDEAFCAFAEDQCVFYRGEDAQLICYKDTADIQEYIGPAEMLPGILKGLGLEAARVRMPGKNSPAGMCRKFQEAGELPGYLGPILD